MQPIMLRMSLQASIPDLLSHLPWAPLHAGWHRPHVQHDIAEYLAYFRRFLIPELLNAGSTTMTMWLGLPLSARFVIKGRHGLYSSQRHSLSSHQVLRVG